MPYNIPGAPSGYFSPNIPNSVVQAAGFNRLSSPVAPSNPANYNVGPTTDTLRGSMTGVQYAAQSQSFPTGGITYPGTGGGGGFNTGGGTTYPGVGSSGGFGNYNSGLNSQNLNVTAGSRGVNNVTGQGIPDVRYADPNILRRLDISDLVYNPSGGGYRVGLDYSHYIGNYGGNPNFVDAAATRRAAAYYNYIGSLPTRPSGTAALNQFYQSFGGGPTPGPSFNSILGGPHGYLGPYPITAYGYPYGYPNNQSTNQNRFGLGY